jgi:hypothetical protein
MKIIRLFACTLLMLCLLHAGTFAQNILLNVLTQNKGMVAKNKTTFLELTISNTSATKTVLAYKLKPQISFPPNLVAVEEKGHVLPDGWVILSTKNEVVSLSNGTDMIPENGTRTILIAIRGKDIGGPSTISGNLSFSTGVAPGSVNGIATLGDNSGDNSSSTTITVVK